MLVVYPVPLGMDEARLADELRRLEMDPRPEPKEAPGKLKSTAPSTNAAQLGGRPGSLHRVFLMRDRDSDEALRYGFAEFWTAADAAAALAKYTKAPAVFSMALTFVVVAATHAGVFVPDVEGEHDDGFVFSPLFNPALRVRYWEPTVYASARTVAGESPDARADAKGDAGGGGGDGGGAAAAAAADTRDEVKRAKKRKADAGLAAAAPKKMAVPLNSTVAMWQKKSAELRTDDSKAPAIRISLSADAALALGGGAAAKDGGSGSGGGAEGEEAAAAEEKMGIATDSFLDRGKLCCLLCMMKYKSIEDVDKHERSRNHKTALEDADKVKAATQRVAKARAKGGVDDQQQQQQQQQQYRDRAKERREAFNQPDRPAPAAKKAAAPEGGGHGATAASASAATTKPGLDGSATAASAEAPAAPKMARGSAMLAKMGWTAGRGLGADGAGRTEIVETRAYQEGVGLGAEGGDLGDAAKLGESRTRDASSYKDYISSVHEKARARYEGMGQQQ
jgi:hypothetical protein